MSILSYFAPSKFVDDPYGYLTNQAGHGCLGMLSMIVYTTFILYATGEYPDQNMVGVVFIALYLVVWESLIWKFKGLDSLEDTLFFALGVFPWFTIDMSQVIYQLFAWVSVISIILAIGFTRRL